MKVLLEASLPTSKFNESVRDGSAGSKLARILEALKPEAVYFTARGGVRTAVLAVELSDPSKIPALAEPWFLTFDAKVEFRVVMSPQDLQQAGLEALAKQWG